MPHQVTVQPSGHTLTVPDGETILQAALNEGFHFPYGCRDGACGSCKGKLLAGEIDYGKYHSSALSDDERAAGYALFCQARPRSDVVIEARAIGAVKDIVVKKLPCRIHSIERPTDDVAILSLKLPATERLQFLAGQYIDFLLKGGERRSFSMANPPHADEFLQLHVRHVPGGNFTDHVFTTMKERDIMRFEGPLGSFFLQESDKPIVFVASGTGFAPIKAIIEDAFEKGNERSMVLYWGGRRPKDLYLADLARRWDTEHANFRFVPVISD
ncbi:MAG: CDP-6-deoxy-delta-3,4-glucoseen reductase, partial [Burkholderiales bacterium]